LAAIEQTRQNVSNEKQLFQTSILQLNQTTMHLAHVR